MLEQKQEGSESPLAAPFPIRDDQPLEQIDELIPIRPKFPEPENLDNHEEKSSVNAQKADENSAPNEESAERAVAEPVMTEKPVIQTMNDQVGQTDGQIEKKKITLNRKSRYQKQMLWRLYQRYNGQIPPKKVIEQLMSILRLSRRTIYKWFWDTNKTERSKKKIIRQIYMPDNADIEMFEDSMPMKAYDGQGEPLKRHQVSQAVQAHGKSSLLAEDFEKLADDMGIRVEEAAQHIIREFSPKGTRQVIKVSQNNDWITMKGAVDGRNPHDKKILAIFTDHDPGMHGLSSKKCCLPNMSHQRPLGQTSIIGLEM